jgi:hypothetical protein
MSAALTLVVSAGVATAAYRGTNGGTDPTALIPSSAFAVATADLSLPGGQGDALETVLGRFKGLHLSGDGSFRDRLLRTLLHSFDDELDYDDDFKPWLGDHVAIAGWDNGGQPEMEIVLESTDDSSARTHLDEVFDGPSSVVMHDGYAVVANTMAAAQAAIAAANKSSLADTGPYAADIDALPDDEAISAWFNGPAAKDVFSGSFMSGGESSLALSGLGMFGTGLSDLLKSRIALGVHVTDTIAELNVHAVDAPTTTSAPSTMLTQLPEGTIGAVEMGDPGAIVDVVTPLVQLFGSFGSGSSETCFGSGTAEPGFAPYEPDPTGSISRHELVRQLRKAIPPGPERRAIIHRVLRQRAHALRQLHRMNKGLPVRPTPMPGCYSDMPPTPRDPFDAIHGLIGINFPDDVKTILGDRAVVSFGGLELAGVPDIAIRSHPTDLSNAQSLANTLSSTVSGETPLTIDVSNAGDDLVLATSSTYGAEIAKAGSLGDQDEVKTALAGMPASVTLAAYVNLSRVWPLVGVPDDVKHLHSVGFWAATAGNVQTAQLRVVFG